MNVALVSAYRTSRIDKEAPETIVRLATALHDSGDSVTILTTCDRDEKHLSAFAPGETIEDGVKTIRFRSDRSDRRRLRELEARLESSSEPPARRAALFGEIETNALVANRPNSTALLSFVARHTDEFDAIAFLGGTSGITLRGWRIAPKRTVVFVHVEDVAEAYLPPVVSMMLGAGHVLMASDEERALARHVYGPAMAERSTVAGSLAAYADESFDRFRAVLFDVAAQRGPGVRRGTPQIVHTLGAAEYAESTTLLAISVDDLLRRAGYRSRVVASDRDYRLGTQIGDPLTDVEPDHLEVVYGDETLATGDRTSGRISLAGPLPEFQRADGKRTAIPPFLDVESWNIEPSLEVLTPLADGKTNLLCVGDVLPENRVIHLIEIFRYYIAMDFEARLIIVGPDGDAGYVERIRAYIERCGLASRVQLTGTISRPALAAMYRTARLFVSLRDHYATGLSLLEAMAFDVPVCVLDSPSARAVTGRKAVLFSGLTSGFEIAALWRAVARDESFRDRIVAAQRSRLGGLTRDRTRRALEDALGLSVDLVRA